MAYYALRHSQRSPIQQQSHASHLNIPRTSSQQSHGVWAYEQDRPMFERVQAQHLGVLPSTVAYDLQYATYHLEILREQNRHIFNLINSHGAFSINQPQRTFHQHPQQARQLWYPYASQGPTTGRYPEQQERMSVLPAIPAVADFRIPSGSIPSNRCSGDQVYPADPVIEAGCLHTESVQRRLPYLAQFNNLSIPVRGPPRKPKQSGHALWVGNIPTGTPITDLTDHFSREATADIESVFLILKSNCAFVNYRTEASCTAAMHRFHNSQFHGVRLGCRPRRASAFPSGAPAGPSAMGGGQSAGRALSSGPPEHDDGDDNAPGEKTLVAGGTESVRDGDADITAESVNQSEQVERLVRAVPEKRPSTERVPEKFFIVKSLTKEDLEQSVRNSIWTTQSHIEQRLNKAYESVDNVYLVFSVNKSGEYFGYARMASAISNDASNLENSTPKPNFAETGDAPNSIPTPATEFAPPGRIFDDSTRGTIFWEVEQADGEAANADQEWGKPFKVEWISVYSLPFHKTRSLRNPLNGNKEVKIARDGTELETSVGKRLIDMFR